MWSNIGFFDVQIVFDSAKKIFSDLILNEPRQGSKP